MSEPTTRRPAYARLLDRAVRILAVRDHSEQELRRKLSAPVMSKNGPEEIDATAEDYERVIAWCYEHHYLDINGQFADVYPGVAEGLQALRSLGLRMACLTNKPLSFAQPLLAAKGLDGFFDCVFGGDSFPRKKPDPMPLVETCKALGSEPARTLMVGDSSNDAQAAHAAGCPVVLMTYGYNHGQPITTVKARAHLDSLEQLVA